MEIGDVWVVEAARPLPYIARHIIRTIGRDVPFNRPDCERRPRPPVPAAACPLAPRPHDQAEQVRLEAHRKPALPAHIWSRMLLSPGICAAIGAPGRLLPHLLAGQRAATIKLVG